MNRSRAVAVLLLAAVLVLHVCGVMSYLVREGRLSVVPIYDDVVYLIDGLGRLSAFDRAGLRGLFIDLFAHPPHAPWITVTSTLGLMLSSGATWGPYLLSSVWVIIILTLGAIALGGASVLARTGILVAALAVPMFGSVIAEFRPDPVWGLLVGFSVAVSAAIDLLRARLRHLLALGALIGAAVIAKPTAAPASAVVLAVGLAVQFALSVFLRRGEHGVDRFGTGLLLRKLGALLAGALCLIVPYFTANGGAILAYVREVMQGGSIWQTQASLVGHLTYYLNRDVGTLMLGWIWYLALPVYLLCATLLVRVRDWLAVAALAGLLTSVLTAYAIVTISGVKSLMIGSLLYGTIVASVVWCLGRLATHLRLRGLPVLMLGLIAFALLWVPRAGTVNRADPAMLATDKASRAVLPVVLAAIRLHPSDSVLVTVPGPVYSGTLDFLSRQQRVERRFIAAYTWSHWEQFLQGVREADVIVLSEAGMAGQSLGYPFPSVAFQPRLLDLLMHSSKFSGQPAYTDDSGRSVWVFVRKRS